MDKTFKFLVETGNDLNPHSKKLMSIQALRFYAAFIVLASHVVIAHNLLAEPHGAAKLRTVMPGLFGVEVFFVISGFIMGLLSWNLGNGPGVSMRFLGDRLSRVLPLYWICTTLYIGCIVLFGSHIDPLYLDSLNAWKVLSSYAFIPYINDAGDPRPYLSVGWTLNYEILFYVLFSLCLYLNWMWRSLALFLAFAVIFSLQYVMPLKMPLAFWSNKLIFHFLIGYGLSLLAETVKWRLNTDKSYLIVLALVVVYVTLENVSGVPAAIKSFLAIFLVALCAFCVNRVKIGPFESLLVLLGDASYSLYLTHMFFVLALEALWGSVLKAVPLPIFTVLALVVSTAGAVAVHKYVEVPVIRFVRNVMVRRQTPAAANA